VTGSSAYRQAGGCGIVAMSDEDGTGATDVAGCAEDVPLADGPAEPGDGASGEFGEPPSSGPCFGPEING
jgi:hypothetical protein